MIKQFTQDRMNFKPKSLLKEIYVNGIKRCFAYQCSFVFSVFITPILKCYKNRTCRGTRTFEYNSEV